MWNALDILTREHNKKMQRFIFELFCSCAAAVRLFIGKTVLMKDEYVRDF